MISNLFLSILSGLLTALSFNLSGFSFTIWFSFSLLLFVAHRSKKPAVYFFLSGVAYHWTVLFWLSFVTRLGLLFLILYLSLYWLLFGYLARFLMKRRGLIFSLPSCWVILEFLRENIPIFAFGWVNFGYSQYKNLELIQIVDIFGGKFISFIILTVNVLIFKFIRKRKAIGKDLIYVFVVFFVCVLYSSYKLEGTTIDNWFVSLKKSFIKTVEENKGTSAGVVSLDTRSKKDFLVQFGVNVIQPNIAQELKWNPEVRESIIKRLKILGRQAKEDYIVVYPEASWPAVLDMDSDNIKELLDMVAALNRDVLMGAVIKEGGHFYNAVIFVNKKGILGGIYRKIKLVPFGEYVPLRKLFGGINALTVLGDISPGSDSYIFDYQRRRIGVLICFEDVFPALVSEFAGKSDFLVNITNDAWFRGYPQVRQHMAVMVFRAIENRISVVRSANTGISGYVDYYGNIHSLKQAEEDVFVQGVDSFKVPLRFYQSVYNRWGEFFPFICLVLFLWAVLGRKNYLDE